MVMFFDKLDSSERERLKSQIRIQFKVSDALVINMPKM